MIHYLIDQSVTKTIVAGFIAVLSWQVFLSFYFIFRLGNKTITALFTVSFALEVYTGRTD